MSEPLSQMVKMTKVKDHTAAGTTDVVSAIVDMAGYEGVMFVTSFGTAAVDNQMYAQQNTANSTSGMAALEGTNVLSGASPSNEDVWIDIYKPRERYIQVTVEPNTSSTVESIWAFQYGARTQPCVNSVSGTIIGEAHASPAEGTA
jgi:hypothetical protein